MNPELLLALKSILPELGTVGFLSLLFLVDGFVPRFRGSRAALGLVILASIAGFLLTCKASAFPGPQFRGMVTNDGLASFFRYLFFASLGLTALLTLGSKEIGKGARAEFSILLLCVTFGMGMMAVSTNLLMLYIAIETVSIISFALAGFSRESLRSNEAAFKYLVYGALASGLMIYGISLLYGFTGSLNYPEIAAALAKNGGAHPQLLLFSLILIYAGFAYKVSAFPFHFWTPDVYEGAPTPVVTFFSVGPKAAGFAAIIRFVFSVLAVKGEGGVWKAIDGISIVQGIALVSAVTMVVGNLSAIAQTNVKRILAFSSISHVGYVLMGLIGLNTIGLTSIIFYLIAYCVMNIGAFWIVSIVNDARGRDDLSAFKGVGWSMPVLGITMSIFLFSLTGIPLFSGFIGKFLIFGAVLQTPGFLWLAVLGVLNSVVSLYYYAKIVKAMWLEKPDADASAVPVTVFHTAGLWLLAVPTIVLGIYFTPVIELAERWLKAAL